jgi:hypothetical protein
VASDLAKTDAEALAERAVHGRALSALQDAGLDPMVGGAYALRAHTGLWRDTKDLDLFLPKARIHEALAVLERGGFRTEMTDPLWIAKAFGGPYFVDLIFSSGNGIVSVDNSWQRHATVSLVLDRRTLIVPPEEMIWSKAYIQERERFDGADIHHLLRAGGGGFDWPRLLSRFRDHWHVLYGHLVSFWFAFPSDRGQIPTWVMQELSSRLAREVSDPVPDERVCRGTLLSRQQYLFELDEHGYVDARELEVDGWRGDEAFPRAGRLLESLTGPDGIATLDAGGRTASGGTEDDADRSRR